MTGLVLEGGAMRGMYTCGILDVLMEQGIHFDFIIGVSAGALFGVNYLSGQNGRAVRYNKRFNSDKNYMGLLPLIREGNILNTDYAYDEVPHKLDIFDNEAFKNSGIPFYAVITNIRTGQAEYIQIEDVFDQMNTLRASASMPFVSRPVTIRGQEYLDGAICDSIPFAFAQSMGCDKLVVISTRHLEYMKGSMSKAAVRLFYKNRPELADKLLNRHHMYNQQALELRFLEKEGKAYVFRPESALQISRTERDPEVIETIYQQGRHDAMAQLEKLDQYLKAE